MRRSTYIRPVGLIARGGDGEEPRGLPLAGGMFDFSGFEILRRNGAEGVTRRATSLDGLFERNWDRDIAELADELQRIGETRPRVAGLDEVVKSTLRLMSAWLALP